MPRLLAVFLVALVLHAATVGLFCALHDDDLEKHQESNRSSWRFGKIFQRWDGQYYGGIARTGYKGVRHMAAFFPLYPALMAPLCRAGIDSAVAGVVVSALAFAAACALAFALAERVRKGAGLWTVVFLVCSPGMIFYDAVYSESLFLLLALAAIHLAGEIAPAGGGAPPDARPPAAALVAGFLLCLVRPQGFILAAALCAAAFIRGRGRGRLQAGWWALPVGAAVVILMSVNMSYGNKPLDWLNAQSAWHRRPSLPWAALVDDVRALARGVVQHPWGTTQCGVRDGVLRVLDLAGVAVGLGFAGWWAAGRRWALALFAAAGVLIPVFTGNLLSLGRFTFASPAIVLALGVWGAARPAAVRVLMAIPMLAAGIYFGLRFTHWCFAG